MRAGAVRLLAGVIRARDVEELIAASLTSQPKPQPVSGAGRLDPAFLQLIGDVGSGFAWLSSELKVSLYKANGAVIGERVTFAPGAAIYAEFVEVGDDCSFGENTVIKAVSLRLGTGCSFGRDNDIMCRRIDIGDMLLLTNRVLIGQGGAFGEHAALTIGHSCLISSDVLINTAHAVTIGNVSCLSPRVCIYTHSHWQNVLEGYTATFEPVTIGSNVWVTGNCLVTPGAVLEDGSQVLANSTVVGRVAAHTVVSGVSARPIHKVRTDLGPAEKDRIMRRLWPEIESALRHAGLPETAAAYIGLGGNVPANAGAAAGFTSRPVGFDGAYFDLESYTFTGDTSRVADEVRNVLRKHGIRFSPHTWRYRADLGRFNS